MAKNRLTQEYIKSILHYDPSTGIFTWLVRKNARIKIGDTAGYVAVNGYRVVGIDGETYKCHRIAWLYMFGYIPEYIDHKNGVRLDNRIENLRPCTCSENEANKGKPSCNTSGFKGVTYRSRNNKWEAEIRKDRKLIYLGCYRDPVTAHQAYCMAAKQLFGEFAKFD